MHLLPRSWFVRSFTNKKELGLFGEMADARTGIYRMSLEPSTALESEEVLRENTIVKALSKRYRNQLQKLPMANLEQFDQRNKSDTIGL